MTGFNELQCNEEIVMMLNRFDTIPECDGQTDRQIEFIYQYCKAR